MQTHFYLIVELDQDNQATGPWHHDWLAELPSLGCSGLMLRCDNADLLMQQWPNWQQRIARMGLALHGISLSADVYEAAISPQVGRIGRLIQQLGNQNALVELILQSSSAHDKPSAPRADSRAARLIRQLTAHARESSTKLALLAQPGRWMQRVEDAARIAMRVNHPLVGLSLDGQTLALSQPESLAPRLQLALPRLWSLIVPDPAEHAQQAATLMRAVGQLGYQGPVGWRCPRENGQRNDWLKQTAASWQRCRERRFAG